jgi:hypothetical protein
MFFAYFLLFTIQNILYRDVVVRVLSYLGLTVPLWVFQCYRNLFSKSFRNHGVNKDFFINGSGLNYYNATDTKLMVNTVMILSTRSTQDQFLFLNHVEIRIIQSIFNVFSLFPGGLPVTSILVWYDTDSLGMVFFLLEKQSKLFLDEYFISSAQRMVSLLPMASSILV